MSVCVWTYECARWPVWAKVPAAGCGAAGVNRAGFLTGLVSQGENVADERRR